MKRSCSIDGCGRPSWARGWCGTHYRRWAKHGDPTYAAPKVDAQTRFMQYVEVAPHGCWLWTGSRKRGGYGQFWLDGRNMGAHRASLILHGTAIPADADLDHLCHKPEDCTRRTSCPHRRCVNPAHIEVTTRLENVRRGGSPSAINGRKTHCDKGHPLFGDNLCIRKSGDRRYRECRICRNESYRAYRARKKAAAS